MKKLFVVSVTIESLVVADSEDEAKELGVRAFRDESVSSGDMEVSLASFIPAVYERDSYVEHTGDQDITVDEAIKTCIHNMRSMSVNRGDGPISGPQNSVA